MTKKNTRKRHSKPPCRKCAAECCRYMAIEIDRPTTKREYDDIRWYLLHKNINVFIDHDGDWHVEFQTPCEALADDHRCMQYEKRPQICRDHGWPAGTCEFFASPYRARFTRPEEYERYLDRKKIDWRYKRRPKPEGRGKSS